MTQQLPHQGRTRLLLGCGGAALALALSFAPQRAAAQGIQATPSFAPGTVTVTNPSPNTTRIEVTQPTTVINWTPLLNASNNVETFLPSNSTAEFRGATANFAVLNRILAGPNNDVATIDGIVTSQFGNPTAGFATGGFVAFYSPTGLLIGDNARFDVGRLMLTTLDTTASDIDNLLSGATMTLQGSSGSQAGITISPGAQIRALQDNSFFAVVAADVEMRGNAQVNGSHAYVAGERVLLSFSNGLFTIFVPVGTAVSGEVVTLAGTIGGPASSGAGDNHMIYGVARAAADPISMLLTGTVGFTPVPNIVNGEIILAADYGVSGRFVGGGSLSEDIQDVEFSRSSGGNAIAADITLRDFTATSSVLAIGNAATLATSVVANSSVAGNLFLFGGQSASVLASNGRGLSVTGDVLVDARDRGVVGSGLQSLDVINAQGGSAGIFTRGAQSAVTIGGRAVVTAEAFGGREIGSSRAGSARGGTAQIAAEGGRIAVTGAASVRASAFGTEQTVETGAEARGGVARVVANSGGSATFGNDLAILAAATAAEGTRFSPSTASDAFGGTARLAIEGNGAIGVSRAVTIDAGALASVANTAGAGAQAGAGEALVSVEGNNLLEIGGALTLLANASGGQNLAGAGGEARGGAALATTDGGGALTVTGTFAAQAFADAGDGVSGGTALGGAAGARAITGTISLLGEATANAIGRGGSASVGFGGTGGNGVGGLALFQAEGSIVRSAQLSIGGLAQLNADGRGGNGGASDGIAIAAGRGGDGIGGQNTTATNPAFGQPGNGVYLLAGSDNARIEITGNASAFARGTGGTGGAGAGQIGPGPGGDGTGGYAQAGVASFGGSPTIRNGVASLTNLVVNSNAAGGNGGTDPLGGTLGVGGVALGGTALLSAIGGEVQFGSASLLSQGTGGEGSTGGDAIGGTARVFGSTRGAILGTSLSVSTLTISGNAPTGLSGDGTGGQSSVEGDGITIDLDGTLTIDAGGFGSGAATSRGDGRGGTAFLGFRNDTDGGRIEVGDRTFLVADGRGGGSQIGSSNKVGRGGTAIIEARGGGTILLTSAQVVANGLGGAFATGTGGNAIGGTAELRSTGTNSLISIADVVPANFAILSDGAILNADGLGGPMFGPDGIGGSGRGGSIGLIAREGGLISLPFPSLSPSGAPDPIRMVARGIGRASSSDGSRGGDASGGFASIEVDGAGSTITMGDALFTTFSEAGSSGDSTRNIEGGSGFGGRTTIRVLNGGSLSLGQFTSETGAQGGNGSGTGSGGSAQIGGNRVELDNGTLSFQGILRLREQTVGGAGLRGGDTIANGEGLSDFRATNSTINLNFGPVGGPNGIALEAIATGGAGVTGGNANSASVRLTLQGTDLGNDDSGQLLIRSVANGGIANDDPAGTGGNARSGAAILELTDARLDLNSAFIASEANGGDGGAISGVGGTGESGVVDVRMNNSTLTGSSNQVNITIRSQGSGGGGLVGGDGTALQSTLNMNNSTISNALNVLVGADGFSNRGDDAFAFGGTAGISIRGSGGIEALAIEVAARATAVNLIRGNPGVALFRIARGSTATVNAFGLGLSADRRGSTIVFPPGLPVFTSGEYALEIFGGSVNVDVLSGFANASGGSLTPSRVVADGGNINVAQEARFYSFAGLEVSTGSGSIIGNAAASNNITNINLESGFTIRVVGDGSAGTGLIGQTLSLDAGNSILLDGNLRSIDGTVSLLTRPFGDPQTRGITMAQGTSIDAGTGAVTMRADDGAITLASISAGQIDVRSVNPNTVRDITVRADGVLTASGAGRAIDLASLGGEVINLAGDAGLVLTGGGHFGIFAATPAGSQIGSLANYARRYNVANADAYDAIDLGGNFAAFRFAPVLTVTADNASRFYGSPDPAFTASFTGFQPGDGVAGLAGSPLFTTSATATSGVGQFTIGAALGSLVSEQGYQFVFAPGVLTVAPRPLTITANSLSRFYGNANPSLGFTIGGLGLVNGDLLSGALATSAGATTGVGTVPITQGTLAASANYALTFVPGVLAITPRPVTIAADNATRIYGNANPAFGFTVGGLGLVNGDQLSGALSTAAGPTTGVGTFPVNLGTLTGGANYALSIVSGQLTITPRPITVTANDVAKSLGFRDPALTFTIGGLGLVNGDQLSGALRRDPGEQAGTFAIRQGTLTGGPNYTLTYAPGVFTINLPPAPPVLGNPNIFEPPLAFGAQPPAVAGQESLRFGIDFPERPDAVLIVEDGLLDDPVASGGDAAVYGEPGSPPGGGQ